MSETKIGEKLKKIRKKRALTQLELSRKARISVNYYARIERDEVNPSLKVFRDILRVLNVHSSEILDF